MLHFTCSACGNRVQGDKSFAAKSVLCPVCNAAINLASMHREDNAANAIATSEDARKAKIVVMPVATDGSFQEGQPPIDPGLRQLDDSNGHLRGIFKHVSIVIALGVAAIGIAWLFASGVLLSDTLDRNWPELPDKKTGVALVIRPEKQTIKADEWPKFTFTVVNHGKSEVILVEPSDGSGSGLRTPYWEWSRRRREPGSRDCGRINSLTMNEVFSLKPGASREFESWMGRPSLSGPGVYRASVRFVNDPNKDFVGWAEHDPNAMALVRRSTPITVVSNIIEIVVVP